MTLPFPTDITQFILWLATGGLVIAQLLEKIPGWAKIASGQKSLIVLVLCVGLPFLSLGLQAALATLAPETLATVQGYINTALGGLVVWAASQYGHGFDKTTKVEPTPVVPPVS